MANGVGVARLRVGFPDALSFAPVRVRTTVFADLTGTARRTEATAEAEAAAAAGALPSLPSIASGGGYSGPLTYRQGDPCR